MKLLKLIDRLIEIQNMERDYPADEIEVELFIDAADLQLQFPLNDIAVSHSTKTVIMISEQPEGDTE
jgi:hypothetical protein